MPFRKALVWIHNQYLDHTKDLFLYSGIAFLLTAAISLLADFLLSWEQWAILVRAALVIPTAASIFILGYGAVLLYVDFKTSRQPEYRTWRMRLSPTMRNRVAALIGAVLFVLMLAVAQQPGYTLAASFIVATVVGLFAFIRKTSKELTRANIGLPDARDAALDSHMRTQARKAAQTRLRRNKKEEAKEEKDADARARLDLEKDLEK
jgi:glucan phosphoethanolaminetransferase (alkaline phosphatase superfamily)